MDLSWSEGEDVRAAGIYLTEYMCSCWWYRSPAPNNRCRPRSNRHVGEEVVLGGRGWSGKLTNCPTGPWDRIHSDCLLSTKPRNRRWFAVSNSVSANRNPLTHLPGHSASTLCDRNRPPLPSNDAHWQHTTIPCARLPT